MADEEQAADLVPSKDSRGKFVAGNRWAWKRGVSGNPKGTRLSDKARELGEEITELGKSRDELAISRLWEILLSPKTSTKYFLQALEILWDRREGRPRQALEITPESSDQLSNVELIQAMVEKLTMDGLTIAQARAQLIAVGIEESELNDAVQ